MKTCGENIPRSGNTGQRFTGQCRTAAFLIESWGDTVSITKSFIMSLPFKLSIGWEEVKEKMRENNAEMTEEDLYYEPGKEEDLLFRLQEKLRMTRQEVLGYVESLAANTDKAG